MYANKNIFSILIVFALAVLNGHSTVHALRGSSGSRTASASKDKVEATRRLQMRASVINPTQTCGELLPAFPGLGVTDMECVGHRNLSCYFDEPDNYQCICNGKFFRCRNNNPI